jgi:eukaryotic-like serine/threonine-protein kinase
VIGTTIQSYRIIKQLGHGGMGTVYLAEHVLLGKRVAVKTLLPEYSRDERLVARFVDEARAAARIRHPGIVEVFDFGTEDGCGFLVMELLEGESLAERLRRAGPLPEPVLVEVMRQTAHALGAAHAAGVVHRDMKPGNIFLSTNAQLPWGMSVKVLDFGVARLTDSNRVRLTMKGMIVGTPTYMAPEQCKNAREVDHRADVYALGCIAFEMATGHPPFPDKGMGAMMNAHMSVPPPLQQLEPLLSSPMRAVIAASLMKAREERLQSMTAVLAAIDAAVAARNESRSWVAQKTTMPMMTAVTASGAPVAPVDEPVEPDTIVDKTISELPPTKPER